jgi:hypothetical protein
VPTQTATGTLFSLCCSKSIDLCPLFGQLQETTIEKYEKTVKDDNIPIVISTSDDSPLQLDQYAKKASMKAGKKPEGSSQKSKDADAAKSPGDIVPESTPTTLSSGSLKRNATFAGLSISRMQLGTTGSLKDYATDSLLVDEFFFHGSFLTAEAYYAENKVYPKEWDELMAFLQKVTTPSLA